MLRTKISRPLSPINSDLVTIMEARLQAADFFNFTFLIGNPDGGSVIKIAHGLHFQKTSLGNGRSPEVILKRE